jgi:hypothetical protein
MSYLGEMTGTLFRLRGTVLAKCVLQWKSGNERWQDIPGDREGIFLDDPMSDSSYSPPFLVRDLPGEEANEVLEERVAQLEKAILEAGLELPQTHDASPRDAEAANQSFLGGGQALPSASVSAGLWRLPPNPRFIFTKLGEISNEEIRGIREPYAVADQAARRRPLTPVLGTEERRWLKQLVKAYSFALFECDEYLAGRPTRGLVSQDRKGRWVNNGR